MSDREAPSGHVLMTKHRIVYCIGDVHGDLRALLRTMRLAGVIRYGTDLPPGTERRLREDVEAAVESCPAPSNATNHHRVGFPLTKEQVGSIEWVGGTSAVVLLGDVLDNRRGAAADPWGVCAMSGTQPLVLEIIETLKVRAHEAGGKVVLVLGNHDVANTMPGETHFCRNYAPQHTTYTRDAEVHATCKNGGFSERHARFVRERLTRLRAVALLRIRWDNGAILAAHGGFVHLARLASELAGGEYELKAATESDTAEKVEYIVRQNVGAINRLYCDAMLPRAEDGRRKSRRRNARRTLASLGTLVPTWCRPEQIDDPVTMLRYFGTRRMVVAHTVQKDGANCTGLTPGAEVTMPEVALCRADVGMSRAFESTRNIAEVVRFILKDDGRVYQSVLVDTAGVNPGVPS